MEGLQVQPPERGSKHNELTKRLATVEASTRNSPPNIDEGRSRSERMQVQSALASSVLIERAQSEIQPLDLPVDARRQRGHRITFVLARNDREIWSGEEGAKTHLWGHGSEIWRLLCGEDEPPSEAKRF